MFGSIIFEQEISKNVHTNSVFHAKFAPLSVRRSLLEKGRKKKTCENMVCQNVSRVATKVKKKSLKDKIFFLYRQ